MSVKVRFKFDASACLGYFAEVRQQHADPATPGLKPGFLGAGRVYLFSILRRFLRFSQGNGDWRRLKPATVRQKGGDRRILRRTDRLMRSLQPGNPGNVLVVDKRGATFGTLVPYAPYHNLGVPGRLPKRQIFVRPDQPTRIAMLGEVRRAQDAILTQAAFKAVKSRRPAA